MLLFSHKIGISDVGSTGLYKQLCLAVEPTPVGGVLSQVDSYNCEDLYRKYLHDFVRLVHKCKHKNLQDETREYEVHSLQYMPLAYDLHTFLLIAHLYCSGCTGPW